MTNARTLGSWTDSTTDDSSPWLLTAGEIRSWSISGSALSSIAFGITPFPWWTGNDVLDIRLSTDEGCSTSSTMASAFDNKYFTGPLATELGSGTLYPDPATYGSYVADVCHSGIQPQARNGTGPICLMMKCNNLAYDCKPSGQIYFYNSFNQVNSGETTVGGGASTSYMNVLPSSTTCGPSSIDSGYVQLQTD